MKSPRSKKKPNLRRTFRLLMVFQTFTSHLKTWQLCQHQEIKTTRWKTTRHKMMMRKIRIMLIPNSSSKMWV
jgi:hypothetical protein